MLAIIGTWQTYILTKQHWWEKFKIVLYNNTNNVTKGVNI